MRLKPVILTTSHPPTVAIGAVTNINVTEVILEQLSTEELRVLEKMLLLKGRREPHPARAPVGCGPYFML